MKGVGPGSGLDVPEDLQRTGAPNTAHPVHPPAILGEAAWSRSKGTEKRRGREAGALETLKAEN